MVKGPKIKLFGRNILLPENGSVLAGGECSGGSSGESTNESGVSDDCGNLCLEEQENGDGEEKKQEQSDEDQNPAESHDQHTNVSADSDNDPKTPLKKPDKIVPCPRCKSADTKFCYYNNYNLNQPRHFCKSCQRYWTNGGTMRNVPVGSGRRKSKNSGPHHCRHITISDTLLIPNGFHQLKSKPNNGTVLSFGTSDLPHCESTVGKRSLNGVVSCNNNGEKNPPTDGGKNELQLLQQPVVQNNILPAPCIPGAQWTFPWNSAVPIPAICPPGYTLPYCSAPMWNVPWLSVPISPTANYNQKATGFNPTSPLGKHSRNGELLKPNKSEDRESFEQRDSILVPKALRIDDPEEAARSSIWSTLRIKYDSFSREGLFKALQPKSDEKKPMINTSSLLQANPAALSRSICFRESA